MYSSQSTQLPGGFTNAAPHQTMSEAGTPDPSWSQMYHNDFNTFVAADLTQSGVGAPTYAAVANRGPGGILALQTSGAAGDSANVFQPVASFQLTLGKHLFFKTRFQVTANSQADTLYAGLSASGATAIGTTDGLFFYKAPGQTGFVLRSVIGSAITDTPLPAACAIADATYLELGFHIDQAGNVEAFFNPTTGNVPVPVGSARGRVASVQGLALTQLILAVCAGVLNGAASSSTMAIDYLTVSAER